MLIEEFVEGLAAYRLEPVVNRRDHQAQIVSICDGRLSLIRTKARSDTTWSPTWLLVDQESHDTTQVGPVAPFGWRSRLSFWWATAQSLR